MKNKKSNRPIWPIVLMAAGVLLILGALAGYLFFSPDGDSPATPTQADNLSDPGNVERVSAADAFAASSNGEAVIVDVRSAEEYSISHIEDAISIPLQDLPDRISELNPEEWIITY